MKKLTKHGKESYSETAKLLYLSYVVLCVITFILILYENV